MEETAAEVQTTASSAVATINDKDTSRDDVGGSDMGLGPLTPKMERVEGITETETEIHNTETETDPTIDGNGIDMTMLLDRYPFNASQIQLLLDMFQKQQQKQRQHQNFFDILDGASSSSITNKNNNKTAAIRWIEQHLIPSKTLISFLFNRGASQSPSFSDFMEHVAKVTGRMGDPNYELIQIYNQVVAIMKSDETEVQGEEEGVSVGVGVGVGAVNDDEDEDGGGADIPSLLDLTYRLALACHVLQHWDDHDHVDECEDDPSDNDEKKNDETFTSSVSASASTSLSSSPNASSKLKSSPIRSKSKKGFSSSGPGQSQRPVLDLNQIKECLQLKNTAMIDSLVEFHRGENCNGNEMYMDMGMGMNMGGSGEATACKVQCQTWLDWIGRNFPQMACILSSFIHLAILSHDHDDDHDYDNDLTSGTVIEESNSNESEKFEEALRKTLDKSSLYALGKRTMFRFPSLEKWVTAKSKSANPRNSMLANIVATVGADSAVMDNDHIVKGGRIGHFAFGMALMDARLCGKWNRMYSTETDGFAFLNLQRAMTGYNGPTIMMIRPTNSSSIYSSSDSSTKPSPGLFGVYTANPWKECNAFYGTSDCFLFRTEPKWDIYRPRQFTQEWNRNPGGAMAMAMPVKLKDNFMYYHPSAGHINTGGHGIYGQLSKSTQGATKPRGLVVGGTMKDPRLHITESLEQCIASSGGPRDATFDSGPLLPGQWDKFFNVDILEVWGVGEEKAIRQAVNAQGRHEGIAEATRRRVQMVDKKQFLEDFQSRLHMGSKLFAHRDGSVRHDFGVDLEAERGCIE